MDRQEISKVVEQVVKEVKSSSMTLSMAKELISGIEEKAGQMGMSVVIAVVDKGARPVAVHCMDGAYIASYDIALNKAFTSAGLKMSTAELSGLSGPGGPLYGIQHTNGGKIVIFGGGEPLLVNGSMAGAVGVSGGTLEEDTYLAAYGQELWNAARHNADKQR